LNESEKIYLLTKSINLDQTCCTAATANSTIHCACTVFCLLSENKRDRLETTCNMVSIHGRSLFW